MPLGFESLAMLFGLAAIAIPVIVHLLNRRRYDVVAWGAMQFLEISQTTRRRLLLEEILLMLVRMAVIAVFVLALAAPVTTAEWLAPVAERPRRDIVVLVDASTSMGRLDARGASTYQRAREWVWSLADKNEGNRIAVLAVQERVIPLVPDLSPIPERVQDRLTALPEPRGSPDWPGAVQAAADLLEREGRSPRREIIILHDGQRSGWSDPQTLPGWDTLRQYLRKSQSPVKPAIHVVDLAGGEPGKALPNFSLTPIHPSRDLAWVGQNIRFTSALHIEGVKDDPRPHRIRFEIDGQAQGEVLLPADLAAPLKIEHRFTTPGVHLVSLTVEPDPPLDKRPRNYRLKDHSPADNRRDLAIEIRQSLSILLVDGDKSLSPQSPSFHIESALAAKPDTKGAVDMDVRAVTWMQFAPELLRGLERPDVVVLADVPELSEGQCQALEGFLAAGGGVLMALGERSGKDFYNRRLYGEGQGFLPGRLDGVRGEKGEPGAAPDLRRLSHPSLALFEEEAGAGLGQARFPRWWQVTPDEKGAAVAWLSSGDPLLIERPRRRGRLLLCTVPLDRTWGATLPGLIEYPVLLHELVYYLADDRSRSWNVDYGQPLRYQPPRELKTPLPARLTLQTPVGESHFHVKEWPWISESMTIPGIYRLKVNGEFAAYYVVGQAPEERESDLAPSTDQDWQRLTAIVPMQVGPPAASVDEAPESTYDAWWLFLLAVVLFLCAEVWLTRRMVVSREAAP